MLAFLLSLAVAASAAEYFHGTPAPVGWVSHADDGKLALVLHKSGLDVLDAATGKSLRRQKLHAGFATGAVAGGTLVLTLGLGDNSLKLTDARSGAVVWSRTGKATIHSVCDASADGKRAVCAMEREIWLLDLADGKVLARRGHDDPEVPPVFAAFLFDGRVAAQWKDGTVRIMDQTLGQILRWQEMPGETSVISPDGRLLYSTSFDHVSVFDVRKGKRILSWKAHSGSIHGLALSPSGGQLLTSSYTTDESQVRLWDAMTGEPLGMRSLRNLAGVSALSWDERALLAGGAVGAISFENSGWRPFNAPGAPAVAAGAAGLEAPPPAPTAPAKLNLQVAFEEPSGNLALDGRETGTVNVTVSNDGKGAAYGVRVALTISGVSGLSAPPPVALGSIRPGKQSTAHIMLAAGARLAAGKASIRVEAKEANGFDADPKVLEIETRPFKAPRLELAGVSLGGTGLVKAGEPSKVTLTIRNAGEGAASKVEAAIDLGSEAIFPSGDTKLSLGVIPAGGEKRAEFEFFVNKRFSDKRLPIALSVSESWGEYGFAKKNLGLVLGEGAPSVEVVAVKAREEKPAAAPAVSAEDVDSPPAADAKPDPDSYAVVVGIEKYRQSGLPAVDFAARDAASMRTYLTRAMGYDPKNVVLLQNEQATKTDLEKYLGTWLRNRVGPKSRVFVYYAGHGAPNPKTGETFLVPYEGDPSYAEDTSYPVKKLYEGLAKLPTKDVTVVLDACFSGAGGRSVIAKGARPLVQVAKDLAAGDNTTILSATSADQISTFYPEGQHGLLTYFLLKGLKGAADEDGDGVVSTGELFGYLKPNVEREARLQNVEQTPTLSPNAVASRPWVKLKKR